MDNMHSAAAAPNMTHQPEDGRESLSDQAMEWLILINSGHATAADRLRLDEWRQRDESHEGAYREAVRLWEELGEAIDTLGCPAGASAHFTAKSGPLTAMQSRHSERRGRLPWLGHAAAAALLAGLLGVTVERMGWSDPLLYDQYTGKGEQRQVELEDGSRLLLDTDTALDVDLGSGSRRVRIVRGQASFEVAADAARPFEVEAGQVVVRALGTVFEVRRDSDGVSVSVQEHAVGVRLTRAPGPDEVRVEAGQGLRYENSGRLSGTVDVPVDLATAWQRRKFIFRDQPLSQVVAEINRYRAGRIFITDAALGKRRVTGVFPMDDPEAALQTIQSALNLRTVSLGPWLLLRRS